MKHLKESPLVQFSVVSFLVMLSLALAIEAILSYRLGETIEVMKIHSAAMMGGMTMSPDSGHNVVSASNTGSDDPSNMQSDSVMSMRPDSGPNMVSASNMASYDPSNMQSDSVMSMSRDIGPNMVSATNMGSDDGQDTENISIMDPEHPASMPHLIGGVVKTRWISFGAVGGGFLILYGSLLLIFWSSQRTITRQQVALQTVNTKLGASSAALERSNRELQDFASVAAHDLQEPLRKVQAFGDRLKSKYAEALEEQGKEYLERMQDASGRMATLINDLLTYSRVNSKGQQFERADLNRVAVEVVSDLETRIEEVGGRVELEGLPTIDADPLQMRQLFQNVIGNALKYHRPEEAPVVRVYGKIMKCVAVNGSQGSPSEELCEITFEDNGIGFDEKYLDRIFGIFQRLQTRSEYEGTGVGLAVCRKIVERHNGTITARSRPDHGSAFVITLPVKQHNNEGVISQ